MFSSSRFERGDHCEVQHTNLFDWSRCYILGHPLGRMELWSTYCYAPSVDHPQIVKSHQQTNCWEAKSNCNCQSQNNVLKHLCFPFYKWSWVFKPFDLNTLTTYSWNTANLRAIICSVVSPSFFTSTSRDLRMRLTRRSFAFEHESTCSSKVWRRIR